MGTGLIAMNLRDKHIALIGDATYDWVCSYFALMAIGAVVVPLDRDLPVEEISDILIRAKCEGMIYHPAIENKIKDFQKADAALPTVIAMGQPREAAAIPIEDVVAKGQELLDQGDSSYDDYTIDDERMATIVFTSGTTGKGKGVMLSQKNIVLNMTNGCIICHITPKTINTLPPHHTFVRCDFCRSFFSRFNHLPVQRSPVYHRGDQGTTADALGLVPIFGEVDR